MIVLAIFGGGVFFLAPSDSPTHPNPMKSLKELCLASGSAESFGPERLRQVERALIEDHDSDMPWYLRIIVAIGAWLASFFIVGFIL
ncbi:MAG: hypothetical protein WDO13_00830 [Verrucomicrobiota bacterium]